MKHNACFPLILALAVALWAVFPQSLQAAGTSDAVAIVNGSEIPRLTFDRELNGFLRRMAQSGRQPSTMNMTMVHQQVVNNLVAGELLWQECQHLKLVPDAAELDAEVAGFKERFKDPAQLKDALTKAGLTEMDLRNIIERQSSIKKLISREITEKIVVSEKDVNDFYTQHPEVFTRPEQVKASHILIKVAADDTAEIREKALARAEVVRKKAVAGDDFAELARTYSEGPSKENGGELPMFSRDRMVKPFSDAAFALKPGDISEIVETEYGYHVIRVAEHLPEHVATLDEVAEGITAKLRQEELNRRVEAYVQKLREKAEITLNVPTA